MKKNVWMRGAALVFVAVVVMTCFTGCASVQLRGDALTAAETSALDAYQAVHRSGAVESMRTGKQLTMEQAYLVENFRQWRFYVRAARKDLSWGPRLLSEGGE